ERHARTGRHSWSLRRKPPSLSSEAEFDGSGALGESPPFEGDADDEADGDSLLDSLADGLTNHQQPDGPKCKIELRLVPIGDRSARRLLSSSV
ncbi:hypothetical protein, partial [Streptomyces antimycoticus]